MTEHPRFRPAGTPIEFAILKRPVEDVAEYPHNKGLYAFGCQASRWGQ